MLLSNEMENLIFKKMWYIKNSRKKIYIFVIMFTILIYGMSIRESTHMDTESHFVSLRQSFENVTFRLVTAFSDNHLNEAITSCTSLAKLPEIKNWQFGFMIAYLLENISIDRINQYKNACPFVEIRKFKFEKYPKFVENLLEYRWKPLIVREMLNEFENIFYFDTITAFNETADETIKDFFISQKYYFSKCGMRQFVNASHTIYAATHPALYKHFNFDIKTAQQRDMYMAGFLTIERNEHAMKIIDKWAKCATEEFCMAPLNSKLLCDGPKLLRGEYADCHRYDQAVLAILLVQHCGNFSNYFLESSLIYPKLF